MPDPVPVKITLSDLTRDDRLRFRDTYSSSLAETVERYAEAMLDYGTSWGEFPPLVAVWLTEPHEWTEEVPDGDGRYAKLTRVTKSYPANTVLLVEGFTRCAAADVAGVVSAPAVVYPGTWADAERLGWRANSQHGRPRSKEETARVLDSILARPEYRTAAGSEIAKLAGCSKATANRHKKARNERLTTSAPAGGVSPPVADAQSVESIVGMVDSRGHVIPARLHAHFAGVPAARKLTGQLRDVAAKLSKLANVGGREAHPSFALVDVEAAVADVLKAVAWVEQMLPGAVCGECHGSGCGECNGLRYLTAAAAY
ncbi:hypothetical protein [Limnoglobus roseus]|uniref:Uncharacterized protein n=1 Tax=Limnoglobus roseus TaxID=2598579 RepID=A0A5C1AL18_9BACT|nr:hypothetical protein [Limnoglobus roseus]QEL19931.1 hypothetical protein PX52LOC_07013 [Limnoglobus roseus]